MGNEIEELKASLAAMTAERDAWKAAYENTLRPKSVHSCDIPGCVSCANPGYTEDR